MKDLTIVLAIVLLLSACSKPTEQQPVQVKTVVKYVPVNVLPDSEAVLVADSITYAISIKSSSENQWETYFLRGVKQKNLIQLLMNGIFNGKIIAYSYADWLVNKKVLIPADSLRNLLDSIGLDRISKIEFTERWFYNPKQNIFYKQVLEMALGYEIYNEAGEIKGYKPLVKISFNPADNQLKAR